MKIEPAIEQDFISSDSFTLASGEILPELKQSFCVYGELNDKRDNAVLVFHALTGSAQIADWWSDLIGAGKVLDTNKFAFVCANYIGSCYGSTSEIKTLVTTGDIVRAQIRLLDYLKIKKLKFVIGGSLGGQLVLQTAIDFPNVSEKFISIGASELPAMGLALNHLQREAVRQTGSVRLARQIAMLSYKSAELFDANFARQPNRGAKNQAKNQSENQSENPANSLAERFDIAGYLDYQAAKFEDRFTPAAYNLISKAMDLFQIGDGAAVKTQTTLIGISSDWLYPARDVKTLAERIKADYIEMISVDGHDAFLSDTENISAILREIINQTFEYK